MLPPFLPSIVDITASWLPEGWPESKDLPQESFDGVDKILDAWQGLVMNEGVVGQAIRRSVLDSIEDGIIVNSKWYGCESYEQVRNSLDDVTGSNEERELAAHILLACYNAGFEEDIGLIINTRGKPREETPSLEIIEGASCGDVLGFDGRILACKHWVKLVLLVLKPKKSGNNRMTSRNPLANS